MLPSGGIDLTEFYARFERLAKGGAAVAVRPPVGAGVALGSEGDTDSRASSHGPACPVDFSHITVQRMGDIANLLQQDGSDGNIPFHKLHTILEANEVPVSRRYQSRLRQWLGEATDGLYYWPPLLAFMVSVDKITLTADKYTRTAYPSLQLQVSFCGEVVKFPPFQWSVGMMQPFEPKKMTRTQQCNARFNVDGPWGITRQDLATALSPQPPTSHNVRISLFGSDCSTKPNLDSSRLSERSRHSESFDEGSYTYHLGSIELWMLRDVPRGDIPQGGRGSEKIIKWHLPVPGHSGPRLLATLNISTHNAGRLRAICGV